MRNAAVVALAHGLAACVFLSDFDGLTGGPANGDAGDDGTLIVEDAGLDAPALPAFRGVSEGASATAQLVLAKPDSVVEGDLLVASILSRSATPVATPAGWALVLDTYNGNSHMVSFVKVGGASEPDSYVFETPSAAGLCGGISAWTGVTVVGATADASGAGDEPTAPSVTTSSPNRIVVALYGHIGDVGYTVPPDMAMRFRVSTPTGAYAGTNAQASLLQAEAGATGAKVARASSSGGGWVAQSIALE
jgi:hypothetical protein